jgi:ATP-binding cassette subfamily F protein 1
VVGPNGKGKTTLLKMIASGDLVIPPRIDALYVEQEVVADDTPAYEAVLRADRERTDLLAEEKKLQLALQSADGAEATAAANDKLVEVQESLNAIGADSAEGRARKILFGLG